MDVDPRALFVHACAANGCVFIYNILLLLAIDMWQGELDAASSTGQAQGIANQNLT